MLHSAVLLTALRPFLKSKSIQYLTLFVCLPPDPVEFDYVYVRASPLPASCLPASINSAFLTIFLRRKVSTCKPTGSCKVERWNHNMSRLGCAC